ncbi:MAG: hypothetical protein ACYC99_17365 [Candidatus Geothermincolia bacterium]
MCGRRVKWCDRFVAKHREATPEEFRRIVLSQRLTPPVQARVLKLHAKAS